MRVTLRPRAAAPVGRPRRAVALAAAVLLAGGLAAAAVFGLRAAETALAHRSAVRSERER